jgi:hypothetical protein
MCPQRFFLSRDSCPWSYPEWHLAVFGDIFDCHTVGQGVCYWHLASRGQGCSLTLESDLTTSVNSAKNACSKVTQKTVYVIEGSLWVASWGTASGFIADSHRQQVLVFSKVILLTTFQVPCLMLPVPCLFSQWKIRKSIPRAEGVVLHRGGRRGTHS